MNIREHLQLSHDVVDGNRKILAKRDSVLGSIIADIIIDDGGQLHNVNPEGVTIEGISSDIEARIDNVDGLDDIMDAVSKDHATLVDTFIGTLRTQVNPVIANYTSLLKSNMEAIEDNNSSWLKDITIKAIDVPDPIVDFPDLFEISSYTGKILPTEWWTDFAFDPRGDISTTDEIFALLSSGVPDMDRSLHAWLLNADHRLLAEAHKVAFSDKVDINALKRMFTSTVPLIGLDPATFIYLYADKLIREPSELATGVDAKTYMRELKNLKRIAGIRVARGFSALTVATKTNLLVIARGEKNIVVVKPLYDQYKADGGTTESLIGSLLIDSKDVSSKIMTDKIFEHTNDYATMVKLRNARSSKSRAATMRTLAYNTFVSMTTVEDMTAVENQYSRNNPENFRTEAIRLAKIEATALSDADAMDINKVALQMITRSRFFYTDAENYLTSMVDIAASNPDNTIDEVRFLATVQYVSRFLATQITYNKLY